MKSFAFVIGAVVLVAGATSFAGPRIPAPKSPAAASPSSPRAVPAGHQTHEKTPVPTVRSVSWAYTKLHQPHVVAAMLQDVKDGKLPRAALAGLGDRRTIDELLGVDLTDREPVRGRSRGAPPKGQTREQAREQTRSGGASGWGALAAVLPAKPEYAPSQLVFADAYDKEIKRATVWFTANRDDFVTASIATAAPFRIHRIASYDGSFETSPGGMLMAAWDTDKSAPFGLSVRAGQQFSVTVEFAPEFRLGTMMAGPKSGKLDVKGEHFGVKVPMSASFNGVRVAGVLLSPTEEELTVDVALTPKRSFSTTMRVLNIGDARTATISADTLPAGVTLVGTPTVALAANETKEIDVAFELDGGSFGNGQPMLLRATAPGGHASEAGLTMNLVQTDTQWEFHEEAEGIDFWLVYRLNSSGRWYFVGREENVSSPLGWEIDIRLELGGQSIAMPIHASIGTMTGATGPNPGYQHRSWMSAGPNGTAWSKAFYAELVARPARFRIELDSRP